MVGPDGPKEKKERGSKAAQTTREKSRNKTNIGKRSRKEKRENKRKPPGT